MKSDRHCILGFDLGGTTLRGAIIDEGCEVPDGTSIGFDAAQDRERFFVTDKGVVLVTAGMLRPAVA